MNEIVKQIIDSCGYLKSEYQIDRMEIYKDVYNELLEYATKKDLKNTSISLGILPCFLFPKENKVAYKKNCYSSDINMDHALYIAKLIKDIHPEITNEEEDIALSVALCHVIVEMVDFKKDGQELMDDFKIDAKVNEIIHIDIGNKRGVSANDYYKHIQENKIALLVKLADRSKIVSQLYMSSIEDAQKYVRETKNNFYSMCIYGKEHYPDLFLAISLLFEKMKNLADVTDILSVRFMQRERILNDELVSLQEENARIRALLKQYNQG